MRKVLITFAVFAVLMLIARLAAPSVLQWQINKLIDNTAGIVGSIGDVDLELFRGAYRIRFLNIEQEDKDEVRPLIQIKEARFSLLWSALFEGELVTSIHLDEPVISLFDRPQERTIKSKEVLNENTWLGLAKDLSPFSIDRLTVNQGRFSFQSHNKQQQSNFEITDISVEAKNISNQQSESSLGSLLGKGRIQDMAQFTIDAQFNPMTEKPTFDVDLKMEKLPLIHLDKLIKFYAPFDFEAGQIDLASELIAEQGEIEGYVKIGVFNIDVFSWHEDIIEDSTNPFDILIEGIGGLLATIFENENKDLVATKIPVVGTLNDPEISTMQAVLGVMQNAFIEAYDINIDNSLSGFTNDEDASDAKKVNDNQG